MKGSSASTGLRNCIHNNMGANQFYSCGFLGELASDSQIWTCGAGWGLTRGNLSTLKKNFWFIFLPVHASHIFHEFLFVYIRNFLLETLTTNFAREYHITNVPCPGMPSLRSSLARSQLGHCIPCRSQDLYDLSHPSLGHTTVIRSINRSRNPWMPGVLVSVIFHEVVWQL